jgi:cathepsin L
LWNLFISMARVFASTVAVVSAGAPDLSGYTYEQWMHEYGVAQNGAEAEATFNDNLRKINEFNAENSDMWLAPNQFMAMDEKTFASYIKGRSSTGPLFQGQAQKAELTFGDIPDRMDWREQDGVVSDPKDQGGCGSCWAFSAVETLESHYAIATGETVKLSPQQIVSCSPNPQHCGGSGGCDGSTQPLAFNYTQTAGITTEANYPYRGTTGTCDTSKIKPVAFNDGYAELTTNSYTELITAVATKGPVSISIAAGGFRFQFYGGGVLSGCNDFVMDHAVQLVGYGTDSGKDYWLVRNSWGGSWGESGYIRMQRYGEGNEPCGTDKKPQDGDACEGDTDPRTYCGECGILSSSSYPTGMRKAATTIEV